MTRRVVEKLCTKKVCVDFLAPIMNECVCDWVKQEKKTAHLKQISQGYVVKEAGYSQGKTKGQKLKGKIVS